MEIYGKLGPHIPKWQWNYPSCRQWGWTMSASPLIPLLWGFWKLHTNDAQLRYWRTCFRESSKIEILCKIISTKFFCFFLMKMTSSVTQPLLLQTTLLGAEQRKPHEAYFQAVACLFRLPQLVSARAEFDATCWRRFGGVQDESQFNPNWWLPRKSLFVYLFIGSSFFHLDRKHKMFQKF